MYEFPKSFVLFDTEFWADRGSEARGWSENGEFREILDIGGIVVDGERLVETASFSMLVKPVFQAKLTPYITELTGITQEMADRGMSLTEAVHCLREISNGRILFCYGVDDEVIQGNCERLRIPYPFDKSRFVNLQKILWPRLKADIPHIEKCRSGELVKEFGLNGKKAHRGMSDAQNLLKVLYHLRQCGRL